MNSVILLLSVVYILHVSATYVGYAPGDMSVDGLDKLTGRTADLVRVYFSPSEGVPSSLSTNNISVYLLQKRHVIISLKFSDSGVPSASDLVAVEAYLSLIAKANYASQVFFTAHHEPYPELSGPDFVNKVYTPVAILCLKYKISVGPILQTYPYLRNETSLSDYIPSNLSTWDFLGIDHYPSSDPTSSKDNPFITNSGSTIDPLVSISSFTSYAKSRGKDFLVAEFGIVDTEQALPHASDWVKAFATVGNSSLGLSYFNDFGFGLQENNGLLVPDYQYVYDAKH